MFTSFRPALAALLLAGVVSPAAAQGYLGNPSEIAVCLCLERSITQRATEMNARRAAYDRMQQQIAALGSDVERSRSTVDTNNDDAVAAYRAKVEQLDALNADADRTVLPGYQSAVAAYNERVNQFTQRCAGRGIDQAVTAEVRRDLVCRID